MPSTYRAMLRSRFCIKGSCFTWEKPPSTFWQLIFGYCIKPGCSVCCASMIQFCNNSRLAGMKHLSPVLICPGWKSSAMHYLGLLFKWILIKYSFSFLCCSPLYFVISCTFCHLCVTFRISPGIIYKKSAREKIHLAKYLVPTTPLLRVTHFPHNLKGSFDIRYQFLETPQNCCLFLTQNYISTGFPAMLSCITDRRIWKYKARWENLSCSYSPVNSTGAGMCIPRMVCLAVENFQWRRCYSVPHMTHIWVFCLSYSKMVFRITA